ncbi:MAG: DUF5989 family protein [Cuspidothrix sp.]
MTPDFVKDLWRFVKQRQNYLLVPVIFILYITLREKLTN